MSNIYEQLNPEQQKAVYQTEGPLLIQAGAGSGKTRTLTHRIAYLIDEMDVNPWNILAVTFTNKAAQEMKERVESIVEFGAESIWVSTFHSTCVRILRRHVEPLGFTTNFSIYDTDDQKTLIHQVYKKLDIDPKKYKDRAVLKVISSAKDRLISPEAFCKEAAGDYRQMILGDIYTEYQGMLKKNNAMDFDDLLGMTVKLLKENPEILDYYQTRFQYIMVDEYQDTNQAQFELVRLLAGRHRNICVVGDDDQSIYRFRGANIRNILDFEKHYPDAVVIRLEQNYRSTQNILNAANEVIRHNQGRKDKTLWTDNDEGCKVKVKMYENAYQEAEYISDELLEAPRRGFPYNECAVLYRTNAQSRILEERMVNKGIPYQLVGGVNFYQRREIKDILAYLKTIDNDNDDLACIRIINVPRRGIGATTIGKIQAFADDHGLHFYEALRNAEYEPGVARGRALAKIKGFVDTISLFRTMAATYTLPDLLEAVLEQTGYRKELEEERDQGDGVEAETRLENIAELVTKATDYAQSHDNASLSSFLEEVALVADVDNLDEDQDRVVLMTLHSAKGLEFDKVYICGMEDGLFPGYRAVNADDDEEMEEERRLAYVGITRARKELTLTAARQRMVNGETHYSRISRFCEEIPPLLMDTNLGRNAEGNLKSGFESYGRPGRSGWGSGEDDGWDTGFSFKKTTRHDREKGMEETSFSVFDLDQNPDKAKTGKGSLGYVYGGGAKVSGGRKGSRAAFGQQFKVEPLKELSYGIGDRVSHIKFGEGTVVDIKQGSRDFEVSVDFDKVGPKRMFASFAKLKKL